MKTRTGKTDLTTGTVWKKLLVFFLPIAAGTCIQQLYNAVDGMIVGKFVGTVALAAVGGSSAQIINLLIGFFVAITSGASVVIAQIYGAGRTKDVQSATGNAIAIFAMLGFALMGIGLAASPAMLRMLKTPAETIKEAALYLRIYFVGVPFILILNMESNMLRAVGDSVSPFLYMVAGCITNIILDVLFVVIFHWGIAGVAAATVAAQLINMVLLTRKLMTTQESYALSLREIKLNGIYLSNMLKMGIPSGLQSSMYAVSNMIIQVAVNTLGTVVVASWAMISKTDGIYWAISNALGAAITSFVGQNLGAGKPERAKECVRQGMTLAMIITVTLSGAIMLAAKPLLRLLTNDPAVISTSYQMMKYFVPFYFAWTAIEVISAVLRGAGDAVNPVIIIGLGICLFRIVWIATVFAAFRSLPALCWCYVASWTVTSTALILYYRHGGWIKRRRMVIHN
ncbi:MAG: MATE family efflux transporter [Oscillospiraceae bacterium]|nr:MATE family efflux transporter [Oscillospiraceae bacterium]